MVTVYDKKSLKRAVTKKEDIIVVKGKLARKLRPLAKIKGAAVVNNNSTKGVRMDASINTAAAGALISSTYVIPVSVSIILIITVGLVAIIAIFNDYNMRISNEEIILEKK